MKGYAGQEVHVRDPLVRGWMRPRDLGWMDEEGYVFLAGRKEDVFIPGDSEAPVNRRLSCRLEREDLWPGRLA